MVIGAHLNRMAKPLSLNSRVSMKSNYGPVRVGSGPSDLSPCAHLVVRNFLALPLRTAGAGAHGGRWAEKAAEGGEVWGEAGEESRTAACLIRQVRLHSLRECGGVRMGLADELRECRPAVANGEARKAETVRTETRTEATEKLDAVTGCRHLRDRRALVAALCASHILLVHHHLAQLGAATWHLNTMTTVQKIKASHRLVLNIHV
jgi:hypothetical protein